MSGRGRGRGGGAPGMIKGATWEFDPELKLESKPTDLFPVRTLYGLRYRCYFTDLVQASSQPQETGAFERTREAANQVFQGSPDANPSRTTVYSTNEARPRRYYQDLRRESIQQPIRNQQESRF